MLVRAYWLLMQMWNTKDSSSKGDFFLLCWRQPALWHQRILRVSHPGEKMGWVWVVMPARLVVVHQMKLMKKHMIWNLIQVQILNLGFRLRPTWWWWCPMNSSLWIWNPVDFLRLRYEWVCRWHQVVTGLRNRGGYWASGCWSSVRGKAWASSAEASNQNTVAVPTVTVTWLLARHPAQCQATSSSAGLILLMRLSHLECWQQIGQRTLRSIDETICAMRNSCTVRAWGCARWYGYKWKNILLKIFLNIRKCLACCSIDLKFLKNIKNTQMLGMLRYRINIPKYTQMLQKCVAPKWKPQVHYRIKGCKSMSELWNSKLNLTVWLAVIHFEGLIL